MAFTLIELLVVISIIGVLAGLIIPLSGVAVTKMRISRVKAELNALVTAIETYKLEVGEYPPDNGALQNLSATDARYASNAALNPLYYELSGAIFTNRQFMSVGDNEVIRINELTTIFNREGIRNSARTRFDVPYKGFSPKPSQYAELAPSLTGNQDIEILAVSVPGPRDKGIDAAKGGKINPWFYDASSTNRHNKQSFDLWAEILVSGKTNIIGNWKVY
jgi:prepilin-type N-terminal cleavage/methylation domain-containing protein